MGAFASRRTGWGCWNPLFAVETPTFSPKTRAVAPHHHSSKTVPHSRSRPSGDGGAAGPPSKPAGASAVPEATCGAGQDGAPSPVPVPVEWELQDRGGECTEEVDGGNRHADLPPQVPGTLLGEYMAIFSKDKLVGLFLGLLLFVVFLSVEMADAYPRANDMLAILGLVGSFWVFEVLPLPVTSILPVVLLPFADIMTSKAASASYWGWVQMLFIGAFMVDIAIEHVNLHRRVALGFLLRVGVKYPWVVMLAFACISYFMSMWCTNTATTVMLTPFARGLLDTAQSKTASAENGAMLRRYSVGVLLTIAYSATCGGIATSIGTIPNGVLAGMPEVNGSVSAQDWFLFAFPVSFLGLIVANVVVYLVFVRGVTLEMDREVLQAEYRALGRLNRDEMVVAAVQLLQIVGWLSRKNVINDPGLKGVNDATIACMAASLLFFIPSVKHPGSTVLTWDVAQAHLPWGVLLLMGGGFAIAEGFKASNLTRFIGEKLAAASEDASMLGLTYLITFVVCFVTEVTSNTATANIMLPILASVATETLTHPLALMLPATVACSFAFMLPAATPPNSVVFATKRIQIKEFVQAGVLINVTMVLLGAPLLYLMGSAVYDTTGPFPEWACLPKTCRWVNVPGTAAGGVKVASQACMLLKGDSSCRLYSGDTIRLNATALN